MTPEATVRIQRGVARAAALATTALAVLIGRIEGFREGFTDEKVYRLLARNLLDNQFYGYAPGKAVAYRAPGYPFFDAGIRLLNDSQASVRVAQALLAGATVALAAQVAGRVFGELAAAATAVLLLAVGTLASYAGLELSETLATVTLVAGVRVLLAAVDERSAALALGGGVLLGLSILTRPQTLLLLLPLSFVVWLATGAGGRRGLVVAAFALGALGTVLPWTVRNAVRLHAFVPVSTYGGINLWLANNERATGTFRPASEVIDPAEFRRIASLPEAEQDREWYRLAFRFIREHPGRTARNWLRDGYHYVTRGDPVVGSRYRVRGRYRIPRLDDRLLWPVALAGVVAAARRRDRARALVPAIAVAYFVAFFMAFLPLPRFRHGVIPLLAVYAGGGVAYAFSRLRRPAVQRSPGRPTTSR